MTPVFSSKDYVKYPELEEIERALRVQIGDQGFENFFNENDVTGSRKETALRELTGAMYVMSSSGILKGTRKVAPRYEPGSAARMKAMTRVKREISAYIAYELKAAIDERIDPESEKIHKPPFNRGKGYNHKR